MKFNLIEKLLDTKSSRGAEPLFKLVWRVLVIIAALISLWCIGRLALNLQDYFRCSKLTSGKVIDWRVIERSAGIYHLSAAYEYQVEGQSYSGTQIFNKPQFSNRHSAEYVLSRYESKEWPVWVSSSNPEVSAIQREFSIKLIVQAILSVGVLIYFFWLKEYILSMLGVDSSEAT